MSESTRPNRSRMRVSSSYAICPRQRAGNMLEPVRRERGKGSSPDQAEHPHPVVKSDFAYRGIIEAVRAQ